MALLALTLQRRTRDYLIFWYFIISYLEDFRRKRIKASLSPLLTQDGIVTAPVLNVLCHWDSWKLSSQGVCAWGSWFWNPLPGCPCEGDREPGQDGLFFPGNRGQGWPGSAGQEPGSARRLCLGTTEWLRTRMFFQERSGIENTRVAISFINESPKERKKNLIKPGTSYTINLSQVWDLSKCFQHLKRESLCSALGFLPMMFKDIISCL